MAKAEIIPAVLVKTRDSLVYAIDKVSPYVKVVHIDVMDNRFVPNQTVGVNELQGLPEKMRYEFHWMVRDPEKWIPSVKGNHLHFVHVETIGENWEAVKGAVHKAHGRLGIAVNPETPIDRAVPYMKEVEAVLIMSVRPGYSGQEYIKEVEDKISFVRSHFPKLHVEVDGGINAQTARSAVEAGATKVAAASAIYAQPDAGAAIDALKESVG